METIIEKLNQISEENKLLCGFGSRELTNWSLEEQKQLLDIYYIISKKEHHILDLHLCASKTHKVVTFSHSFPPTKWAF
jgi:hypothetical protein